MVHLPRAPGAASTFGTLGLLAASASGCSFLRAAKDEFAGRAEITPP